MTLGLAAPSVWNDQPQGQNVGDAVTTENHAQPSYPQALGIKASKDEEHSGDEPDYADMPG